MTIESTKPPRGQESMRELRLLLNGSLSMLSIRTRNDQRGLGAASALVQALLTTMKPGATIVLHQPPCLVGTALSFWASRGFNMAGARDHPLPPPGARGRQMPSSAVAATMIGTPEKNSWTCAGCNESTACGAVHCSNLACGLRRPTYPKVIA